MDADRPQSPRNNRPLLSSPRSTSIETAEDLVEVDPLEIKEELLDLDIEHSLNTSTHIEDSSEIDNLYVKEEDIANSENFIQETSPATNFVVPVIKEVISLNKQKASASNLVSQFSESLGESDSHLLIVKSVIEVKLHKVKSSRSGKPFHKTGQKQETVKVIEKPLPDGFIRCIDCGFPINKFQTSKNCRKCGAKVSSDSDLLLKKCNLKAKKLKMSEKKDHLDLNINSAYIDNVTISNERDSNNDLKENNTIIEDSDFTNKEPTVSSIENIDNSQNNDPTNLSHTETSMGSKDENLCLDRISPTSYFSKLELGISDLVKQKSVENTKDAILGQDALELYATDCSKTKNSNEEIKLDPKINSASGVSEHNQKEAPIETKIPADKLDLVIVLKRIDNDINLIKSAPETTFKSVSSDMPAVNNDNFKLGNDQKNSTELCSNKEQTTACKVTKVGSSKRKNIKTTIKKKVIKIAFSKQRNTLRASKMSKNGKTLNKTAKTDKRHTKILFNMNSSDAPFSKQRKPSKTLGKSKTKSSQPLLKQRTALKLGMDNKNSKTNKAFSKQERALGGSQIIETYNSKGKPNQIPPSDGKSAQAPIKERKHSTNFVFSQDDESSKANKAFLKERKTSRALGGSKSSKTFNIKDKTDKIPTKITQPLLKQSKTSKSLNLNKDDENVNTSEAFSKKRKSLRTLDISKSCETSNLKNKNKTDQRHTKITFDVKSTQPLLIQRKNSKTLNLSKDDKTSNTKGKSGQRSTKIISDTNISAKSKSIPTETNASFINSFLQFVKDTTSPKKDEVVLKSQEKLIKIILHRLPEDVILTHINKKDKEGKWKQDGSQKPDKHLRSSKLKTSKKIRPVQKCLGRKPKFALKLKMFKAGQKFKDKARSHKVSQKAVDTLHKSQLDLVPRVREGRVKKIRNYRSLHLGLTNKDLCEEKPLARTLETILTNKDNMYPTLKDLRTKYITRVKSIDKLKPVDKKITEIENQFNGPFMKAHNIPDNKYVYFLEDDKEFHTKKTGGTPRKSRKASPEKNNITIEKKIISEENIFTQGNLKRKAESDASNQNLVNTKKAKTVNLDTFTLDPNKNQLDLKRKLTLKEKVQNFKGRELDKKKSIIKNATKFDINNTTKLADNHEFNQEINSPKSNENDSLSKQCVYCEFLAPDKKSLVAHILGSCKNFTFAELITCPNCDVNVKVKCTNCASKCDIKDCTFSTWFKKVMLHHKATGIHNFKCENCHFKTSNFIQFNSHICFKKNKSPSLQTKQSILTKQQAGIFVQTRKLNDNFNFIDDYYISELPNQKKQGESMNERQNPNDIFKQKLKYLDDNYILYALNDSDDINSSSDENYLDNRHPNVCKKSATVKKEFNKISSGDSEAFAISTTPSEVERKLSQMEQPEAQHQTSKKSKYSDSDFISELQNSDSDFIPEVHDSDSDFIPESYNSEYSERDCIPEVDDSDDSLKANQVDYGIKNDQADKIKNFTKNKILTKVKRKSNSSDDNYVPESDDDDDSDYSMGGYRTRHQDINSHSKNYSANLTDCNPLTKNLKYNKEKKVKNTSLYDNQGNFDHLYPKETIEELKKCQKCKYTLKNKKEIPYLQKCPKCKHIHVDRVADELNILSKVLHKDLTNFKDIVKISDITEDQVQLKSCRRCGFVSSHLSILLNCRRCNFRHKNRKENKDILQQKLNLLKDAMDVDDPSDKLLEKRSTAFKDAVEKQRKDQMEKRKKYEISEMEKQKKDKKLERIKELKTCQNCGHYVPSTLVLRKCPNCLYRHQDRFDNEFAILKELHAYFDTNQYKDYRPTETPAQLKTCRICGHVASNNVLKICPKCRHNHKDRREKQIQIKTFLRMQTIDSPGLSKPNEEQIKLIKTCRKCGFVGKDKILLTCNNCSYVHEDRCRYGNKILLRSYDETANKSRVCPKCNHVFNKSTLIFCPKCQHPRSAKSQLLTNTLGDAVESSTIAEDIVETCEELATCRSCGYYASSVIVLKKCPSCFFVHLDRLENEEKLIERAKKELDVKLSEPVKSCAKCKKNTRKEYCDKCQNCRQDVDLIQALSSANDIVKTTEDLRICLKCGHIAPLANGICSNCHFVNTNSMQNKEKLLDNSLNFENTNEMGNSNYSKPNDSYEGFSNDPLDDIPNDPINGGLNNSEVDNCELQSAKGLPEDPVETAKDLSEDYVETAEDLPEGSVETAKELPDDSMDKSVGIELLDDWIAKGDNIEIIFEDELNVSDKNGLGGEDDFNLMRDLENVD